MLLFHLNELGHGGAEAEIIRISRVNAANQGLDKAFECFVTKAPADEGGEAFVRIGVSTRDERLDHHPEFGLPGEDRADQDRPHPAGGHQDESFRDRQNLAIAKDERASVALIRADHFIGQAEPMAKLKGPGLVGDKAVGSAFAEKAVDFLCPNGSTDA